LDPTPQISPQARLAYEKSPDVLKSQGADSEKSPAVVSKRPPMALSVTSCSQANITHS